MGYTPSNVQPELRNAVVSLYQCGMNATDIGKMLAISEYRAYTVVAELGIARPKGIRIPIDQPKLDAVLIEIEPLVTKQLAKLTNLQKSVQRKSVPTGPIRWYSPDAKRTYGECVCGFRSVPMPAEDLRCLLYTSPSPRD